MFVQVTAKNVGVFFMRHSVHQEIYVNCWTCLGGVFDLTRRKVRRAETADWIADVDARRRDDCEQRQQEDGPLAIQLVAETVRAAQLSVMDVTEEEEQPVQHGHE